MRRALPEADRPRQRWIEWRYLVLGKRWPLDNFEGVAEAGHLEQPSQRVPAAHQRDGPAHILDRRVTDRGERPEATRVNEQELRHIQAEPASKRPDRPYVVIQTGTVAMLEVAAEDQPGRRGRMGSTATSKSSSSPTTGHLRINRTQRSDSAERVVITRTTA